MTDVVQHLAACRPDIEFLRGNSERVHQLPGVGPGALAGAESRHGIAAYGGARNTQPVAGPGGNNERMRRIEPAGNADHQRPRVCRFDAPHQSVDLDVEGLVAIRIEPVPPVGHEGEATNRPRSRPMSQAAGARLKDMTLSAVSGRPAASAASLNVCSRIRSPRIRSQSTSGNAQLGFEAEPLGFRQQVAQFINHSLPVPGKDPWCSRRGRQQNRRKRPSPVHSASGTACGVRRTCRW